ncbi:hypothetical protein FRX31_030924 [Thalictrum thalictroides]|uniref:Retrotransposon gag domain-containing protein n=1 Tax=Thalictrum thalictroides TaxID=46969 RepID=A0A7J6V3I9_THATH|nr:hypothetical protein FRX31_030924 [Thalictrum thalictroides]
MIGKEVWDIVTGAFPKPRDEQKPDFVKNKAKWERNTAKIITWINISVDKTIQIELSKFDTTKDCWDHLKKIINKSNYAREYQLENDIKAARQKDSTIQQFYHEMTTLWEQLDMVDSTELLAFQPYADKRKRQKLF